MPQSVPNENGSTKPTDVPYGPYNSFPWKDLPEWGGATSTIFRSADGKTVVASIKEEGPGTLEYEFDEFFYVTEGTATASVHGGESFTLNKGDCVFFPQGSVVDFNFSKGFQNIAVLLSDKRITAI